MSNNKADLATLLAESAGSGRHKMEKARPAVTTSTASPAKAKGRGGTSPITVHFPKQVRDQLKIMAVQRDTTLHALVAEAYNDLFAKYGKPEIAPSETMSLSE
jgi:hypothetical protein